MDILRITTFILKLPKLIKAVMDIMRGGGCVVKMGMYLCPVVFVAVAVLVYLGETLIAMSTAVAYVIGVGSFVIYSYTALVPGEEVCSTPKPSPEEKDHDPDTVIKLVLKHGCSDHLSVGLKLGFSNAEIIATTAQQLTAKAKLQALIQEEVMRSGKPTTAKKLLEVSQIVPTPFYGAIMEELEKNA